MRPRPGCCWTLPPRLPDNPRAIGRGPTYHCIFALCYGLGLRAAEACALRLGDVDADRQLVVVVGGKFGKSRLVPHGPRIGALLGRQVDRRRSAGAQDPDAPLFTFDGRRSMHPGTASQTFHHLVTALAFPVADGVAPPRLHSLRHSFAVGCLLRWYRDGIDPATRLFQLSTFMGHVDPTSTAVYLTDHPGTARPGQPAVRIVRRTGLVAGTTMTRTRPLGPIIQSFFLDHLITVKGLRPAIGAQLPRHHPAAAVLPGPAKANQDHPARPGRPDLRPTSSASCATWKTNATTMFEPGTNGWRSCTPCSTTSPPGNPTCSAPASG